MVLNESNVLHPLAKNKREKGGIHDNCLHNSRLSTL